MRTGYWLLVTSYLLLVAQIFGLGFWGSGFWARVLTQIANLRYVDRGLARVLGVGLL